jgi:uncharacterized membrane protein
MLQMLAQPFRVPLRAERDPPPTRGNDRLMILWFKLIHIVAVIVFLGNITLGIFWKAIADKSGDPRIISHTLRGIILADRWFTIPAIFVLVAGGVATALAEQIPILATGWILWAIILFVISGLAFAPVAQLQRRLEAVASDGERSGKLDSARYDRISAQWNVWGMIALLAPVGAVALMVLKPVLPAFH